MLEKHYLKKPTIHQDEYERARERGESCWYFLEKEITLDMMIMYSWCE